MADPAPSVLITGANGFVGARLCRFFLNEKFRVIAGVRRSSDLTLLKDMRVEYRFGDVTSPESLPSLVSGVDYIIHNAGIVKAKNPRRYFEVNEQGTQTLLESIGNHNATVKRVIYVSSLAAVGPGPRGVVLTEETTPHPVTTYGKSKLAGERAALSFADRIPVTIVRPSGVYGPGDKEVFSIFKTADWRIRGLVGDLNRKIQMIFVDDLSRGIFQAAVAPTKSGSVYFLAEKEACTYKAWIETLERAVGKKGFPLVLPAPIFRLIASISGAAFRMVNATPMLTAEKAKELLASWEISIAKAERELAFEPKMRFAEGAAATYQWYKKEGWL